jgi:signal transduction histidine kinase/ActR/RegA family two-component response regulator
MRDRIHRAVLGHESHGESVHGHAKDGRAIVVEVHAASRRAPDGSRLGVIIQAVDATARSDLEAQFRQAQKMEAIGHLAGGIAHDVNNTLTAVGGFAGLIEQESTEPHVQADAAQISSTVRRASQLTKQLLAFARRAVLQPETIEVAKFVATMRPMVQRLLGEDIDIVLRDEASDATVVVDAAGFEQALLNLAINARDAMPSGGTLKITTSRRAAPPPASVTGDAGGARVSDPGNRIVVSVADTGGGIPEDVQEQVFEPFFTTKGHGKGTGLGLAMVYGFVTQSGGSISLRSKPGAGTTIDIELPEGGGRSNAAPVGTSATSVAGRETVLLVEDEPAVASFSLRVLQRLGYRVLDARDGTQAIAVARAHHGEIALILSDVIMPGQTGPEVAAAVREIHPEAAVLYASGYLADAIEGRGVIPAGVDLIQKPYAAGELAERVRAALDRRDSKAPDGSDLSSPSG